jgi:hypothetical protein
MDVPSLWEEADLHRAQYFYVGDGEGFWYTRHKRSTMKKTRLLIAKWLRRLAWVIDPSPEITKIEGTTITLSTGGGFSTGDKVIIEKPRR